MYRPMSSNVLSLISSTIDVLFYSMRVCKITEQFLGPFSFHWLHTGDEAGLKLQSQKARAFPYAKVPIEICLCL